MLLAAASAALSAGPASAASVTVSPTRVASGGTLTVTAAGLPPRARGSVRLGGRMLAPVRAGRRGTLSESVRVPRGARPGGRRAVAVRAGRRRIIVPVRLVRRTPRVRSSLTVSDRGHRVALASVSGARVRLRGSGFRRRARVRASLGRLAHRTRRASRRGGLRMAFAAPPRLAGRRRLTVASAGVRLSIPFRVRVDDLGALATCPTASGVAPRSLGAPSSVAPGLRVTPPYRLDFVGPAGGLNDAGGLGTGFTRVEAVPGRSGHVPANLRVGQPGGTLAVTTTKGTTTSGAHWADNALGVGIDAPSHLSLAQGTLLGPCATGAGEEAGIFFGVDQRNQVRLAVVSGSRGTRLVLALEDAGQVTARHETAPLDLSDARVALALRADPTDRTVAGSFRVDDGPPRAVGTVVAPGRIFSFDAAGGDNEVGTRTFTGLYATHKGAKRPSVFRWDDFTLEDVAPPRPVEPLAFGRTSFAVRAPTSIEEAPDGRLYVSEMGGRIHVMTLDARKRVTADRVSSVLGSRLLIGLEVDPRSTASDVVVWATHSSPGTANGVANSGVVSRLSGPGLARRQDVITGLPRAQADHAPNSLHFGPDGRLYIAVGSNTAGGAPNAEATRFGTIDEQSLSGAILVADVRRPGFDGSCANTSDLYGPPPCEVTTYATGIRNAYDFVFHPNGSMYSAVNGLGGDGAFPRSPRPPCAGPASPRPFDRGGQYPGPQPDLLLRVERGRYYGHPNASRGECVFADGRYQRVPPLPTYTPPMYVLGQSKSANGTIAYRGGAFGGALRGDLLIANWSVGDDITRIRLSPDGRSVASATTLATGFENPLPLAEGRDGTIYVGEFLGNRVTVLRPGR